MFLFIFKWTLYGLSALTSISFFTGEFAQAFEYFLLMTVMFLAGVMIENLPSLEKQS